MTHAVEESSQLQTSQLVIHVLTFNQIVRPVLQVQHAQLATPDTLLMHKPNVQLALQIVQHVVMLQHAQLATPDGLLTLVIRVLLVILLYHLALNVVVMELHVPNAKQTCSQIQVVRLV